MNLPNNYSRRIAEMLSGIRQEDADSVIDLLSFRDRERLLVALAKHHLGENVDLESLGIKTQENIE